MPAVKISSAVPKKKAKHRVIISIHPKYVIKRIQNSTQNLAHLHSYSITHYRQKVETQMFINVHQQMTG
jgi:hypothetical protein